MEACFISKTVTQVTSLSISASFASKFQHFLLFMCEKFPTCWSVFYCIIMEIMCHHYVVYCRSPWSGSWPILHPSLGLRPESPDVQPEMCGWRKLFVKVDCCQDWSTRRKKKWKKKAHPLLSVIQRVLSHNNHFKVFAGESCPVGAWDEVKLTKSCRWWCRGGGVEDFCKSLIIVSSGRESLNGKHIIEN